jgi:hypothetical protein
MSRLARSAVLLAAVSLSMPASAAVSLVVDGVDGTYTQLQPRSPGVYGVELRGGRPGARDWEIGVGNQTSNAGTFNQGEFDWTANEDIQLFSLTWQASGLSITIDNVTVTDSGAGKGAPLLGNTLKIDLKGVSGIGIGTLDGQVINSGWISPATLLFFSDNGWGGDGFTVTGALGVLDDGGSRNGITFKVGNFTPNSAIPEPATWAMLIAGFGLVGTAMRRRRAVAAA